MVQAADAETFQYRNGIGMSFQKVVGDARNVPDGRIKRGLVDLRRLMETANLAYKLQSGGGNLLRGHQRIATA